MEVPRLLVDAGLVAFSTAAIFIIRRLFHQCRRLENNIDSLNKTLNTTHTDEEKRGSTLAVISEKLEQITDTLTAQHDLQLEQGDRQEDLQKSVYALTNKVKEEEHYVAEAIQKTLKVQEHLNDYFMVLDNDLSTKVGQIDNTLKTLFARWEHQLEPHMNASDKAHQRHQENFTKVKESFQELADNVCRELSLCNQRLASTAEAIAEHRDHYAHDRRQFIPNQHRPYGRDTRSQRGLLRQAAYESRCGSHSHETRPQRRDCGPVRQEPPKRPLVDVIFDDEDDY